METIASAAIMHNGQPAWLPAPARHHHVMFYILCHNPDAILGPEAQGFITSDGRFVGRKEAAHIAKASGQITETKFQPDYLFSEDVW